ncbi:AAA family ATPase [Antrihabitans cavernicola]|uniref:AAA family ATPase n=2 Tax=Antrihabitans cavernicola TaxID=2495913 RepID=A0A5A7S9W9_9NOCA|nr:AAA family ATPase [Spelaeibacter cavernicola]
MWPDRDVCREALRSVEHDDWYKPAHADLAAVIRGMFRAGQTVDAMTAFGQCQAQGFAHIWDAPQLVTLMQTAITPEGARTHANRVRALSGMRKLAVGATRAVQALETGSADETGSVQFAIEALREKCDEAESVILSGNANPDLLGMGEFLAQPSTYDWLVPGLLERMDRVVITGAEGGGKSVLCTQIAACLAGGVHPFTGRVMGDGDKGVRVLVLDCENSPNQSRRRYRWVVERVKHVRKIFDHDPIDWSKQMAIDFRPGGIDLLGSRDRAWIEHSVQAFEPDLVVLGPLYKLHFEDPNAEAPARKVSGVLDGLRERYGFALLTEAHSGKGKTADNAGREVRTVAPVGSSMWLRWPEFGFGLRRAPDDPGEARASIVDVVPWRGAREERAWPNGLSQGSSEQLPWIPDADYYQKMHEEKYQFN